MKRFFSIACIAVILCMLMGSSVYANELTVDGIHLHSNSSTGRVGYTGNLIPYYYGSHLSTTYVGGTHTYKSVYWLYAKASLYLKKSGKTYGPWTTSSAYYNQYKWSTKSTYYTTSTAYQSRCVGLSKFKKTSSSKTWDLSDSTIWK